MQWWWSVLGRYPEWHSQRYPPAMLMQCPLAQTPGCVLHSSMSTEHTDTQACTHRPQKQYSAAVSWLTDRFNDVHWHTSITPFPHETSCLVHTADTDKTVLSCLCRRCELNCRQVKTLLETDNFETEQFCSFVLSQNAVWTEFFLVSTQFPICKWHSTKLFSLKYTEHYWKLSWLVANSVHTTDMNKTTQSCLVSVGGVNSALQQQASYELRGLAQLANLKMPIHAHFIRLTILTRKVHQNDLVSGVSSGIISRSAHARLKVSVCSGYNSCHAG